MLTLITRTHPRFYEPLSSKRSRLASYATGKFTHSGTSATLDSLDSHMSGRLCIILMCAIRREVCAASTMPKPSWQISAQSLQIANRVQASTSHLAVRGCCRARQHQRDLCQSVNASQSGSAPSAAPTFSRAVADVDRFHPRADVRDTSPTPSPSVVSGASASRNNNQSDAVLSDVTPSAGTKSAAIIKRSGPGRAAPDSAASRITERFVDLI